jgi:ACR3 family arsenite efflux pump ArsB
VVDSRKGETLSGSFADKLLLAIPLVVFTILVWVLDDRVLFTHNTDLRIVCDTAAVILAIAVGRFLTTRWRRRDDS